MRNCRPTGGMAATQAKKEALTASRAVRSPETTCVFQFSKGGVDKRRKEKEVYDSELQSW